MLSQFKNRKELLAYFSTEKACVDYLISQRWEDEIVCPHCGASNPYITATRSKKEELQGTNDYKCRAKDCRKKFNVLTGTIFENTKIELKLWFEAIYVITNYKKGVSSHQVARDLGCTQKTAWFILHRIREMLKNDAPDMLIEGECAIDEWYHGGLEGNKHKSKRAGIKGRINDKVPVVGVYSEGTVKTFVVEHVNAAVLATIVEKAIEKKSMVVTDGLNAYRFLDKEYHHVVVDHSGGQYVNGRFHTNGIENFWSLLSRGIIGVYHYVSPEHLAAYCNEFAYRYNTRKLNDRERFNAVIKRVGNARITYNELTRKQPLAYKSGEALAKNAPIAPELKTGFEFLDDIDLDTVPEG